MPYSPSLATFEKDCGPDQERRLFFLPALCKPRSPVATPFSPCPARNEPLSRRCGPGTASAPALLGPRWAALHPAGLGPLQRARGHPRGAGLSPRVGFGRVGACPAPGSAAGAPCGTGQGERGETTPGRGTGGRGGAWWRGRGSFWMAPWGP